MEWPEDQRRGFALAAAAHGDAGAALALPGLAPAVAERATTEARRLARLSRDARRSWVRGLLSAPLASVREEQAGRPARALALLASSVDKSVGRRWLERAPLPRAGYVPDPRLLSLLHKLALRPQ